MNKAHILIVDDEEDVCKLIQDRLKSLGYEASYVLNGPDALSYAEKKHPDLIILDIMMPGMDGYEVSKRLIDGQAVSTIPIIMLTAHQSQGDKLKALMMGIDDYITKPFDFEELVARIESVLRRSRRQGVQKNIAGSSKVLPSLNPEDQKRLKLIREMINSKVSRLDPIYNVLTQTGYTYPLAAKVLELKDGSEINDLDLLVERQCLQREFFDKILLCPFCKNYNLNIREVCPACKSPHLKIKDMIHHYRCAYTGIEDEFKEGIQYVCPKCHRELRNIGVDYDKPGQNYFCEACKNLSTSAETRGQCRACDQIFEIENSLRQVIYSYHLSPRAKEVIEKGAFLDQVAEETWIDQEVDVYNLRYLRSLLSQEIKQAEHFTRPLSLLMLSVENYQGFKQQRGDVVAVKLMKDLTQTLKESLRDIDIPARFQENSLVVMMTELAQKSVIEIAKAIQEKITKNLKSQYSSADFAIRTVTYPNDGKNEDALLKNLLNASPTTRG